MGDKSKIEWTDATWNVTYGCTRVSRGCDNCYAVRVTQRLAGQYHRARGLVGGSGARKHFNGNIVPLRDRLEQPLKWKRPRRIFVNSLSDLFHPAVPQNYIAEVFAVMAGAHRHTFQVLTKRPDRMAEVLSSEAFWSNVWHFGMERWWGDDAMVVLDELGPDHPLPNVWCGTSVEDQAVAHRIFPLFDTPAAVRFLSCEPLVGSLDLRHIERRKKMTAAEMWDELQKPDVRLDWVIVGGESGPGARPCNLAWVRRIVQVCQEDGVPVFVKQLGARPVTSGPKRDLTPWSASESYRMTDSILRLQDPKGGDIEEWPEELRVREWPDAVARAG